MVPRAAAEKRPYHLHSRGHVALQPVVAFMVLVLTVIMAMILPVAVVEATGDATGTMSLTLTLTPPSPLPPPPPPPSSSSSSASSSSSSSSILAADQGLNLRQEPYARAYVVGASFERGDRLCSGPSRFFQLFQAQAPRKYLPDSQCVGFPGDGGTASTSTSQPSSQGDADQRYQRLLYSDQSMDPITPRMLPRAHYLHVAYHQRAGCQQLPLVVDLFPVDQCVPWCANTTTTTQTTSSSSASASGDGTTTTTTTTTDTPTGALGCYVKATCTAIATTAASSNTTYTTNNTTDTQRCHHEYYDDAACAVPTRQAAQSMLALDPWLVVSGGGGGGGVSGNSDTTQAQCSTLPTGYGNLYYYRYRLVATDDDGRPERALSTLTDIDRSYGLFQQDVYMNGSVSGVGIGGGGTTSSGTTTPQPPLVQSCTSGAPPLFRQVDAADPCPDDVLDAASTCGPLYQYYKFQRKVNGRATFTCQTMQFQSVQEYKDTVEARAPYIATDTSHGQGEPSSSSTWSRQYLEISWFAGAQCWSATRKLLYWYDYARIGRNEAESPCLWGRKLFFNQRNHLVMRMYESDDRDPCARPLVRVVGESSSSSSSSTGDGTSTSSGTSSGTFSTTTQWLEMEVAPEDLDACLDSPLPMGQTVAFRLIGEVPPSSSNNGDGSSSTTTTDGSSAAGSPGQLPLGPAVIAGIALSAVTFCVLVGGLVYQLVYAGGGAVGHPSHQFKSGNTASSFSPPWKGKRQLASQTMSTASLTNTDIATAESITTTTTNTAKFPRTTAELQQPQEVTQVQRQHVDPNALTDTQIFVQKASGM